jgi:hypothetical protein
MISFPRVSKQYGRQELFVDASFQQPGREGRPGRAETAPASSGLAHASAKTQAQPQP